jgi:hypothetical protein
VNCREGYEKFIRGEFGSLTNALPPRSAKQTIPFTTVELRALCRVCNRTLYDRLISLTDPGQIVRCPERYRLATQP